MSYDTTVRRRAELRKHLNGSLDALLDAEARQFRHRAAAREIHIRVMRARLTAGDIRGR